MQRLLRLVATLALMMWWPRAAVADGCPYTAPYAVPLDLMQQAPLAYTRDLRVFNIYWHGNDWDDVPQHRPNPTAGTMGFQKADIDAATQALLTSGYFNKTCQYGVPRLVWAGSHDNGQLLNRCPNPISPVTLAQAQGFVSCEESAPFTDVPTAIGIPGDTLPGGAACALCGLADPCFANAGCLSVPNPTGDLLINLFLPADHVWSGFPNVCTGPHTNGVTGFHFQIPSNDIGFPFSPIPFTQGRPIYVTVIFLNCFDDIRDAMDTVSHEMVEAATSPFPFAFWAALTSPTGVADAGDNESADICEEQPLPDGSGYKLGANGKRLDQPTSPLSWTDASGSKRIMQLASYWSNFDHACVSVDDAPPVLSVTLSPPPNASGWNNTDVQVSILATDIGANNIGMSDLQDRASGATTIANRTIRAPNMAFPPTSLSDSLSMTQEGISLVVADATDFAGLTTTSTVPVQIDKTAPLIGGLGPKPEPNQFGWNRTPVSRTFTCDDALSGITTCTSPVVVAIEGKNVPLVGRAIDEAGNETDSTTFVNIDATPPVITFSGNFGTYAVDAFVNIGCSASDALSGVRTDSCTSVSAPAYTFNIGSNSFSATALDYADNSGQSTATFTVVVTFASMINLTNRFVTKAGVANALVAKLQGAAQDAANGNVNAKTGKLNAYTNEVSVQAGKALSDADAQTLVGLLKYL